VFGKPNNFRVGSDWNNPEGYTAIAHQAATLGIKELWVPDPHTFNREVVRHERFHSQTTIAGVVVHYGVQADGIDLERGMTTAIITGDCPTLTLATGEVSIVAHAGLESLLPSKPSFRLGNSVIDQMIRRLPVVSPYKIDVVVSCHIGEKHLTYPNNDPTWGKINRERRQFIKRHYPAATEPILPDGEDGEQISLLGLITSQLLGYGIGFHRLIYDGFDTAAPDSPFHSHRRDGASSGRNAVIVDRLERP
jgi:copper oxidase (laccase) domain-containing protein